MVTPSPTSVRWSLWIVAFGFFMQTLDTTIVNTALPSMAASLGESPLQMYSVIVSYLLTVAIMLPVSKILPSMPAVAVALTRFHRPAPTFCAAMDEQAAPMAMAGICT